MSTALRTLIARARNGARTLSTSSASRAGAEAAASGTSAPTAYPYSKTALLPTPVPTLLTPNIPSLSGLKSGKGLMYHLRLTLPTPAKLQLLNTLFSRSHPSRVRPGDVLNLTMEHAPTSFTGVLLGVRRKGMDTNFTVRNVMQRTGVELNVRVCSPHLKEVKVVGGSKKGGKRSRRAKMFYLRDSPEKMGAIAGAVRKK